MSASAWSAQEEEVWLDGLLRAGAECRPIAMPAELPQRLSNERAAVLQGRHMERLLARIGGVCVGRKVGASSAAALKALGIEAPFVGPILSARLQESPARFERAAFIACIVEAEVAVRLRDDLPAPDGPPTRAQLLDAIDLVAPAIEIADSRIADWGAACAAAIVSDLGYAGAWVRGAACEGWRDIDLAALAVEIRLDGALVRDGSGAQVLGDPLHALALVVAAQARSGCALRAGEWISTGSMARPLPMASGGRLVADFGPLGRVELALT